MTYTVTVMSSDTRIPQVKRAEFLRELSHLLLKHNVSLGRESDNCITYKFAGCDEIYYFIHDWNFRFYEDDAMRNWGQLHEPKSGV